MLINGTVTSVTGKMIAIAYQDCEGAIPRVTEAKTPLALKNWEVEKWIDTLEIRCAYKGQKWGLEKQHKSE